MDLPQVTIERWEHQGKIPYKVAHKKIVFKKSEILKWAAAHDLTIKENRVNKKADKTEISLADAIRSAGVYKNIY